jgi:hypothetical protein
MLHYRVEHIRDGRYLHTEASSPNDPALARACQKYGWKLEECRLILLKGTESGFEQKPEKLPVR